LTGLMLFSVLTIAALLSTIPSVAAAAPAPRCLGRRATIVGTPDNDRLRGTPKEDVIVGLGGHDRIFGRAGDDIICADSGFDRINGGAGDDVILGGRRQDSLKGQQGDDRLLGEKGLDFLWGGAGNDVYQGGSNSDAITFRSSPVGVVVDLNVITPQDTHEGIDTINGVEAVFGSIFDDVLTAPAAPQSGVTINLFGDDGNDDLRGGAGIDVLEGWGGNDRLTGGVGDDELFGDDFDPTGGVGKDVVYGGDGNDFLFGGFEDDQLFGEAGDDWIDGWYNQTGPPSGGDFGDGGPNATASPGDVCLEVERAANCETFTPLQPERRRPPANRWSRWRLDTASGGLG
jgi:Ca2+-binding RTX toxin-like protein